MFIWPCLTWPSALRALLEQLRSDIWNNCVAENIKDAGGSNTDVYGEVSLRPKIHLIAFCVHSQKGCECDWTFVLKFSSPCNVSKGQEWTTCSNIDIFFHQLFPPDSTTKKHYEMGKQVERRKMKDRQRQKMTFNLSSYLWQCNSFTHLNCMKRRSTIFFVRSIIGQRFRFLAMSFSVAWIQLVFSYSAFNYISTETTVAQYYSLLALVANRS